MAAANNAGGFAGLNVSEDREDAVGCDLGGERRGQLGDSGVGLSAALGDGRVEPLRGLDEHEVGLVKLVLLQVDEERTRVHGEAGSISAEYGAGRKRIWIDF